MWYSMLLGGEQKDLYNGGPTINNSKNDPLHRDIISMYKFNPTQLGISHTKQETMFSARLTLSSRIQKKQKFA